MILKLLSLPESKTPDAEIPLQLADFNPSKSYWFSGSAMTQKAWFLIWLSCKWKISADQHGGVHVSASLAMAGVLL